MDAETKARVFEPLFTTKGPGKGSGLGMAMIAGLIEQHNGFVEVQSEVGAGTTIRLYFPAVDTTPRPRPMPISIAEVPSGAEMILVAEDNGPLRRAARLALKKFGYTVLLAPNGEEALSLFRANKESIVLVVSDMMMPKMNGIELYRAIRKESKGVKFLFSSGYAADDIEAHASDLAEVPSLKKPWRLAELAARVREVLDEAPVG
jgi:CheY-like chemotaxis protein